MNLFRSEEHVDRWCAPRELVRGELITADQAWRLAQGWYKDKLRADWRRHSLEEAEALLTEIGLVGPFWSLRG